MRAEPQSALMPATAWRRLRPGNPTAVVLLAVWAFALYWRTTLSMASIWARSETFTHGFVVFPIFVWLVWRQRDRLAAIPPVPFAPALLGVAAAGAAWIVGELVSAASVSQFAMVALVPFSVWAVLGSRVAGALAIPLAFLFFAVPFGEFLVPTLMDRTADVAISAIRASGVPIYREGNSFMIPSGRWSVVEACSGLRYLIASFMVGTLYAYLSYRSPGRRVAFIAASIVVPIVANWFRAYMIVMLGHLTDNRVAVGVDHLIYGWVFFGVVMALLFLVGARWREDLRPEPAGSAPLPPAVTAPDTDRRVIAMAAAVLVLTAIPPPALPVLARAPQAHTPELAPLAGRAGWEAVPAPLSAWRPDVKGERAELRQTFANDGRRVGLHVAFFVDQTPETKAITSLNQLVSTENKRWKRVAEGSLAAALGARTIEVRTGVVTDDRERLATWQWFWVDGRATSSEYLAKLYQALAVLRGRGDAVAWVFVYAPADDRGDGARATLEAFVAAMSDPIDAALARAAAP